MKRSRNNKCNAEIIIKKKCNIKSRQWWKKKFNLLTDLLLKALPKKKKKLLKTSESTIVITNNKEIKTLNSKYRKKNKPTDVLSFQLEKKEQLKTKYLGDVVISIEKATKQAKETNTTLETELFLLLTHAYLHLLGYDHILKKDARVMFKLQNKVLINSLL